MSRAYLFVDGENHFIRSQAALKRILGRKDAVSLLPKVDLLVPGIDQFPASIDGKRFGWNPECHFFWDCRFVHGGYLYPLGRIERAVYVTCCAGDDEKLDAAKRYLREREFEPIVIAESKHDALCREAKLLTDGIIEKPKGCDIALATRMVEDGAADLYDSCCLFTSDADFLPAVEAVRRMGKLVWVYGYGSAIQKRSPYYHVPDRFVDLDAYFERTKSNDWAKIDAVFKAHPATVSE